MTRVEMNKFCAFFSHVSRGYFMSCYVELSLSNELRKREIVQGPFENFIVFFFHNELNLFINTEERMKYSIYYLTQNIF